MDISSAAYDSLSPTELGNFTNPLRLPGDDGIIGILDASDTPLRVTTCRESIEVLPGKRSEVLAYRVERNGKIYLNPTIRVRTGANFSAELANGLDEETTIHWHGLHVTWRMDGHPLLAVAPDATYRYAYPVENRGDTYWYHPHAYGTSARQTYSGLAGFFMVEDEEERRLVEALDLKLGGTDIPLLIQDKMFDEGGNFLYAPGQMEVEMGYQGDVVLTNLTPNPYVEVSTRIYRFRILNGSNARNFRLAFSKAGDDELLPYHVIATDGSLLERPARAMEVFLSPAERVEVLVDLRGFEVGEEIVLRSLPFEPMHNEHEMGGDIKHMDMGHHHHKGHHMGPPRLPDGSGCYLLRLVVSERVDYARRVPEILSEPTRQDFFGATTWPITLSMATEGGANRWLINGLTHERDEYPLVARRGAKEIWEIHNDKKSMPHPMHLHGFRFRVLGRTGSPEQVSRLAVDESGRAATDLGFKDTVLAWPGETAKVAIDFSHSFEGEHIYEQLQALMFALIFVASVSLLVRLHHARGVERQQIKWVAYAGALAASASLPTYTIFEAMDVRWLEMIGHVPALVGILGIPTAVGIAILRYRLYEIDLLINRTLVYGSLTAILVAHYFGSIVWLQMVFVKLTGQRSTLAVVASTLVIAALFNPFYRWVQAFVDRRFYRRKYNARRILVAFSAKLRDETDLDALRDDLVGVVRETMQSAHVSLWLRPDPDPKSSEGEEPREQPHQ